MKLNKKPVFVAALLGLLVVFAFLSAETLSVGEPGDYKAAWTENYPEALTRASAEDKPVLVEFTGSDWCIYCKKMDAEVLTQKEFADFAEAKLVLVKLDFPRKSPQDEAIAKQNKALKEQFEISGFPTFVLLGPDGKEWTRFVGYVEGGPKGFVDRINAVLAAKGKS